MTSSLERIPLLQGHTIDRFQIEYVDFTTHNQIYYIATNQDTKRRVTISEYYPTHFSRDPDTMQLCHDDETNPLFQKYIQAITTHKESPKANTIKIDEIFIINGSCYGIHEYATSLSMADYLSRSSTKSISYVLEQGFTQLGYVINTCHQSALYHGEISLQNILIDDKMQLTLRGFTYDPHHVHSVNDHEALIACLYQCITKQVFNEQPCSLQSIHTSYSYDPHLLSQAHKSILLNIQQLEIKNTCQFNTTTVMKLFLPHTQSTEEKTETLQHTQKTHAVSDFIAQKTAQAILPPSRGRMIATSITLGVAILVLSASTYYILSSDKPHTLSGAGVDVHAYTTNIAQSSLELSPQQNLHKENTILYNLASEEEPHIKDESILSKHLKSALMQ